MRRSEAPTCDRCGAPIKFIRTAKNRKWLPVNPTLYSGRKMKPGTVLVTEEGDVVHIHGGRPQGFYDRVEGYISHHKTCPKLDNSKGSP